VRRAAGLTRRLLAFARRQPLDARALDVNALLAGLTELLRRAAGDAVAVEIQPAEALWRVRADANGLDNALLNLVVNARDAMPEGGRVLIETANAVLDAEEAARFPEPVPPGVYVRISVTDTGTGMDAATLARVFEPFFTTKEPGKGTGLGLAQIHGFVRQSGGQVSIESRLGEGTRVCLFLPRLRPEDEASEAAEQQAEAPAGLTEAGRGETLLLVEDDEALRLFATETLTELGYQVLAAANGAAALQLLEERPEIKLLFTDVLLPGGMDGRHLAGLARERWPELRLLLTTGHGGVVEARDSPIGPGISLLRKPYSRADLAAALRRLLDTGG
jgi:CheY-like chemotaxis protein